MKTLVFASIGLFIAALAAPAAATTLVRRDLAGLAKDADAIVVGQVQSRASAWRDGRIVTTVVLAPERVLKGAAADTVTVEVLGGVVDGIGQRVHGMAAFEPGEQVAVFLERAGEARFRVAGLAQGKLRLDLEPTGAWMVRDLSGLTLVERAADGTLRPVTEALPERMSLEAFARTVAAVLEER